MGQGEMGQGVVGRGQLGLGSYHSVHGSILWNMDLDKGIERRVLGA